MDVRQLSTGYPLDFRRISAGYPSADIRRTSIGYPSFSSLGVGTEVKELGFWTGHWESGLGTPVPAPRNMNLFLAGSSKLYYAGASL